MLLRGSFASATLGLETGLTVLVPDNFDTDEPYRVVYLLHGLFGSHGSWTDYTRLPLYAAKHRAVFVCPDGGRSFYTDMAHGGAYLAYVADELPAAVSRVFNISRDRDHTVVIGGSMGGYGALKVALSRPDCFGACAALSACCLMIGDWMRTPALQDGTEPPDFAHVFGEGYPYDPAHDVVELAKGLSSDRRPKLYLSCGLEDSFLDDHRRYHTALNDMGYAHTYRELPGGHDWAHFDTALHEALKRCLPRPN